MKRIIIVGTSGSGKTTLGKKLSQKLNIPLVDLDEFFWLPNWVRRTEEDFANQIKQAVNQNSWIICGNQSKYRPLFWPKADTVIWLDLPFPLLFWRVFQRGIRQFYSKENICNGNKQTPKQFFWILGWVIKSYFKRKKTYTKLKAETPHLNWIHIQSKREI